MERVVFEMRDFVEYVRAPDLTGDNSTDCLHYDLDAVIFRVEVSDTLRKAFSYRQTSRLTVDHLQEICLGIGQAASLMGYMREGDPWEYPTARQDSPEANAILSKMDRLRIAIAEKIHTLPSLHNKKIDREMRRAIALMILSINAASGPQTTPIIEISGLWTETQDPQGDAQLECEDAFAEAHIEIRSADVRGEHHASISGTKASPFFTLAQ